MNKLETWLLHASNFTVAATGLIYAYMHYLLKPADPFSVVNHPWEPPMLKTHILVAPFLILTVGLIVHSHIILKLSNGARGGRKSGIVLIPSFIVMALSGYLLQVFTDPAIHTIFVIIHIASGLLWLGSYLSHQISAIQAKRTMGKIPVIKSPGAAAKSEIA